MLLEVALVAFVNQHVITPTLLHNRSGRLDLGGQGHGGQWHGDKGMEAREWILSPDDPQKSDAFAEHQTFRGIPEFFP